MRILAASDIHGRHQVYAWLLRQAAAKKPDAVVLAGDLLGVPEEYETVVAAQEADRVRLHEALTQLEQPVLYVMGNDDWIELEAPLPDQHSIHGRRIRIGHFNFVGYQYTLPFMGGVHEKAEEEIEADLMMLETLIDEQTILVTHSPAYGILDRGILDRGAGSISLGEFIERTRPRAHVHGHIHRDFGRVNHHFNVAAGGTCRAMMIDLDSMKHKVLGD